jgi:hypothetical protein
MLSSSSADSVHSFIRGGESKSTLFLDGRKNPWPAAVGPTIAVVGKPQRLVFAFEASHHQHRAEDLFPAEGGGRVEPMPTACTVLFAAAKAKARCSSTGGKIRGLPPSALPVLRFGFQSCQELVGDALLQQQASAGDAHLPLVMLIDNTHADSVHSFIRGGESKSTLFLDGRKNPWPAAAAAPRLRF